MTKDNSGSNSKNPLEFFGKNTDGKTGLTGESVCSHELVHCTSETLGEYLKSLSPQQTFIIFDEPAVDGAKAKALFEVILEDGALTHKFFRASLFDSHVIMTSNLKDGKTNVSAASEIQQAMNDHCSPAIPERFSKVKDAAGPQKKMT